MAMMMIGHIRSLPKMRSFTKLSLFLLLIFIHGGQSLTSFMKPINIKSLRTRSNVVLNISSRATNINNVDHSPFPKKNSALFKNHHLSSSTVSSKMRNKTLFPKIRQQRDNETKGRKSSQLFSLKRKHQTDKSSHFLHLFMSIFAFWHYQILKVSAKTKSSIIVHEPATTSALSLSLLSFLTKIKSITVPMLVKIKLTALSLLSFLTNIKATTVPMLAKTKLTLLCLSQKLQTYVKGKSNASIALFTLSTIFVMRAILANRAVRQRQRIDATSEVSFSNLRNSLVLVQFL